MKKEYFFEFIQYFRTRKKMRRKFRQMVFNTKIIWTLK